MINFVQMKKIIFLIIGFLLLFTPKDISAAGCGTLCDNNSQCQGATNGCTECRDPSLEGTGYGVKSCQEPLKYETRHKQTSDSGAGELTGEEEELNEIGLESLVGKVNKFLPIAMGLGGVIAFILIVIGGFQIILSAGNPDKVKAGQEMITSAIAGLLLIIFSVFILRLIGYDILKIPDFG